MLEVIRVAASDGIEMILLFDDVAPPWSAVELLSDVFEIECKTVPGVDQGDRNRYTQMRLFHVIVTLSAQNFPDLRSDRLFDGSECWGKIFPSLNFVGFDFILQGFFDQGLANLNA